MVTQFNKISMNNTTKKYSLIIPVLTLMAISMFMGCEKYKELADTEYPDQVIYMSTASTDGTPYEITRPPDISEETWQVPTPGSPILPCGCRCQRSSYHWVWWGGKDNIGTINISIVSRPDTVSALISDGGLQAQLLPQSAYSFPSSITLQDGKDAVSFDLVMDQGFLLGHPDQAFAIGISISSNDRKTNPQKETTVVVFNTSLLVDSTRSYSCGTGSRKT